eukprot:CAMPEP_0115222714 /NCGR_PEP_ID=MMETSP0270-20121206/28654_1 /TAXON_ID=71861 /ORGANISM="Scrippsiella trochoidea, Strain CCMP3099" /LENGTH=141 /DNA_ID=CAMNT_0002636907 /DNA_START=1904 /DNA_END=2328 /DNA_ORIENTATION=-
MALVVDDDGLVGFPDLVFPQCFTDFAGLPAQALTGAVAVRVSTPATDALLQAPPGMAEDAIEAVRVSATGVANLTGFVSCIGFISTTGFASSSGFTSDNGLAATDGFPSDGVDAKTDVGTAKPNRSARRRRRSSSALSTTT